MTDTTQVSVTTISGRTFLVQGPTPHYGTYMLTSSRGAQYITTQAFTNAPGIHKLVGGLRARSFRELQINGHTVHVKIENGQVREATHADIQAAIRSAR